MLRDLERSTIKFLRKKKKTFNEIAQEIGCTRKTVARALKEPIDKRYAQCHRVAQAEHYRPLIEEWLKQNITISRMLDMVRNESEKKYTGGKSAFYDYVAKVRCELEIKENEIMIRFEGLPGEYLQIDWGERRDFPFVQMKSQTRYFFAARLKHSRVMYVEFHKTMCLETLVRCILRCFEYIGGSPWSCVFDNMKTVTIGRDENNRPIWNETFQKFSNELGFHREICDKAAGNQKGAVENLVRFVKDNFLSGRVFLDDSDLDRQCAEWLSKVNNSICQAHREIPFNVLPREQEQFTPLVTTASEYGILYTCKADRESFVHLEAAMYSVPEKYAKRSVIARVSSERVRIYDVDKSTCIADHPRSFEKGKRIRELSHFEATLEKKPKARIMVYRDFLVSLDSQVAHFISHLCYRRRGVNGFGPDILKLYELYQRHGKDDFLAAVSIASEWESYGAEYVEYILEIPSSGRKGSVLEIAGIPAQDEIDRNLASYLPYVKGGKA